MDIADVLGYDIVWKRKNTYGGVQIMGNAYGYVRVSSRDQNEDRQVISMRDAGTGGKYLHR